MSIVNVSDIERCTVAAQPSGTECGETALVRKLCERVILIHELRQRRRSEELAYCSYNGTDIDERLRSERFVVLNGHSLLDDLIHTGKTDSELILEKLSDAAQAAVAEMVDIVGGTDAVRKAEEVVDRRKDILAGNMLR